MNMDKSIALQQQVRENSQSLQDEFFNLKNWEEDMKKADKELKNTNSGQNELPPIRKKKIASRPKPKTKDNGSKSKRIKSQDYSSWEQFDADKACDEIDKENESEESGEEILTEEELEKKHEEASKHKVTGNKYVQEKKWDKAMACYSEAIKIFPFDAVFFANRALCHLKMDNLYSAEADCTSAIQLDGVYIKAYHRRATARIAFKQYSEAIDDLKYILTIEKNNKEAQNMLSTAQKLLDKSKSSLEKKDFKETPNSEIKEKTIKEKSLKDLKTKFDAKNAGNDVKKIKEESLIEAKLVEEILTEEKKKIPRDWLFYIGGDAGDDVDVVKAVKKSPHQRSKKALKSVPIVAKELAGCPDKILTPKNQNKPNQPEGKLPKERNEIKVEKFVLETDADVEAQLPPVPRSSIQFLESWKKHKSPEFRYKYLKQIHPESLPKIFQDCMESDTFSGILSILSNYFIKNNDPVFNYIKFMAEIKRFRALTMFMGSSEKKDLIALFEYCKKVEMQPDKVIQQMRDKYEI